MANICFTTLRHEINKAISVTFVGNLKAEVSTEKIDSDWLTLINVHFLLVLVHIWRASRIAAAHG